MNRKGIVAAVIAAVIIAASSGIYLKKSYDAKQEQKKHDELVEINAQGADVVNSMYLNMGDQKVLVGSTIQVEAFVVPDSELAAGVEFISSDENIFTVDGKGMITVNAKGTATLTAATGNLASSIIIEGVENTEEVESNAPYTQIPSEYAGVSGTSTLKPSPSQSSESAYVENPSVDTPTAEPSGERETPTAVAASEEEHTPLPVEELDSVRNNIESFGFTKCQDSSYAIYSGETYCGQVIVDAKAIYIGVKVRTTETDDAFLNVLKIILPDSYNNCFSIFNSTSGDRVMNMDDHKVNIMTGGDHTFINIYALEKE